MALEHHFKAARLVVGSFSWSRVRARKGSRRFELERQAVRGTHRCLSTRRPQSASRAGTLSGPVARTPLVLGRHRCTHACEGDA